MARVKRGVTTHARHKKILDLAKGYRGRGSTAYRAKFRALNLPDSQPGDAQKRAVTS